jgi:hypothetical protein
MHKIRLGLAQEGMSQLKIFIEVFGFETRLPTTRILTRLHVSSLPNMLSDETRSSGPGNVLIQRD